MTHHVLHAPLLCVTQRDLSEGERAEARVVHKGALLRLVLCLCGRQEGEITWEVLTEDSVHCSAGTHGAS